MKFCFCYCCFFVIISYGIFRIQYSLLKLALYTNNWLNRNPSSFPRLENFNKYTWLNILISHTIQSEATFLFIPLWLVFRPRCRFFRCSVACSIWNQIYEMEINTDESFIHLANSRNEARIFVLIEMHVRLEAVRVFFSCDILFSLFFF